MAVRAESLSALERAAHDEAEAARRLGDAIRDAGAAMASLDTGTLEEALTRTRVCSEALSRAGTARSAHGRLAARALGLSEDATLGEIADRVAGGGQGGLPDTARRLATCLEEAALEVAAQALAARYGAGLWSHVIGLAGAAAGASAYGPSGRVNPSTATVNRRV